jgi:histidine triad (HIT) family protein
MSIDGVYDPDNIFAKIVRGEMPSAKVWEDDSTFVFMDAFPQSKGHTLAISKTSHARNLLDAEPETAAALILTTQKITRAVRAALKPDGIVVTQFNGAAAGQTIFHLHFHIIPRWAGAALGRHAGGAMADIGELRAQAEAIRAAL